MALAQKRVPYAFQRPATRTKALYPRALPAPRPVIVRPVAGRMAARQALPSLRVSLAIGGAAIALAVAYVGGYARMTGVNYRKVRIQQAAGALLTQQQLLHSEIILRTDERTVAAWAEAHGMQLAGAESVVVHRSPDDGALGSAVADAQGRARRVASLGDPGSGE